MKKNFDILVSYFYKVAEEEGLTTQELAEKLISLDPNKKPVLVDDVMPDSTGRLGGLVIRHWNSDFRRMGETMTREGFGHIGGVGNVLIEEVEAIFKTYGITWKPLPEINAATRIDELGLLPSMVDKINNLGIKTMGEIELLIPYPRFATTYKFLAKLLKNKRK